MDVIKITGQIRPEIGKRQTKALRRQGHVPCEMYGDDKNIHFSVDHHEIHNLIFSSEFKLVDLELDGNNHRCLIKEVQFHPIDDKIVHIDFQKLIENRKVNIEVPVRFEGISPGVKNGGKLIQKVRKVKVRTIPEKIVNEIVLDISNINLGQSVRVRDITAGEDFEILNNPGIPLASVEVPRALKSATPEEEAAEAAAAAAAEASEEEKESKAPPENEE